MERTFGWQDIYRKLAVSYDRLPEIPQRRSPVGLFDDQFPCDFQYVLALTRYEFYIKAYWLAVIFESASSLQITLQSSASTNVGDYGAEGPIGGANVLRPVVAYGALPSTYPSVTSASFDTANIPRIWLRSGV